MNDYPCYLDKSYGEILILDHIVDYSDYVKKTEEDVKVTGRFPILNVDKLLAEAERRRPWELYCDCKDHPVGMDMPAILGSLE